MNGLKLLVSVILIVVSRYFYMKLNYSRMFKNKNFDYLVMAMFCDGFGLILFVLTLVDYAKSCM